MRKVIYSENAVKDLRRLDKKLAQRIVEKICFFSEQDDLGKYSKALVGFGPDKYRFRIGDYRAIFRIDELGKIQVLMVLNVKHRKEIYTQR